MNEITQSIFVILAVGVIVALIFWAVRQNQSKQRQKLIQLCTEKGWHYEAIQERLAKGSRISSAHWSLEAVSRSSGQEAGPGSSDMTQSTIWRSDLPGAPLFIGPRLSSGDSGSLGEGLARQILNRALGAEAAGMNPVPAGSDGFRQAYIIWSGDEPSVRKALTPEIESILLNWPAPRPLIKRTAKGLSIELQGRHVKDAEGLLQFIRLGETLLSRLKND